MSSLLPVSILEQLQNISISSTRDANVFTTSSMIITNDLIYDTIFAAASPGSILCLARTCQAAHAAMRDYFARAFNINKHLTRFFHDPLAFRSLQARTTTLISGSSALQFFDRTVYESSDLNLYVPLVYCKDVGNWMLAHGYQYIPNSAQDPDFNVASDENHINELRRVRVANDSRFRGVAAFFRFHRPSPVASDKKLQVQVVVAKRSPIEVILRFYSTVTFNVISWDRAYSLYPRCTFEHRNAIFFRHRSNQFARFRQKYSNRGFEFTTTRASTQLSHDPALVSKARWIGDKRSWVLELSVEGITLPPPVTELSRPLTRDPCYLTTWRRLESSSPTVDPILDFQEVEPINALYYAYVMLQADTEDPMFQIFVWARHKWTKDRAQSKDPNGLFGYYDQYLIEACEEDFEKDEKWRMWC